MKAFRTSQPEIKKTQQLIQTLESRRLMSLTSGFEFGPIGPPPPGVAIEHAFATGQPALESGFGGFNPADQLSPPGSVFPGDAPDPQWLESQFAHAIAQGNPITLSPPPMPVATANNLYSLYGSLGTSTVIQIDTAAAKSTASILSDSLPDQTHGSFAVQTSAGADAQASVNLGAAQIINLQQTAELKTDITSDKALAQALSSVVAPVHVATLNESPVPTWSSLRKLEVELIAVKTVADQVVAELGRESAIALSHLESFIDPKQTTQWMGSWCNWRSGVAIAGAAAAAMAIAQLESDAKKEKPVAIFSNRLIEEL